jgi:hypothetical protein
MNDRSRWITQVQAAAIGVGLWLGCACSGEPEENRSPGGEDASAAGHSAAGDGGAAGAATDATPGSAQVPPVGHQALEPWLAAGHYKAWRCEANISPRRLNGAHGKTRVCANEALLASTAGEYPVGAASVKELYTADDKPNGFAVGLKIAPGAGAATWYWFERLGERLVADGDGSKTPLCSGCHRGAARDNVFVRPDMAHP